MSSSTYVAAEGRCLGLGTGCGVIYVEGLDLEKRTLAMIIRAWDRLALRGLWLCFMLHVGRNERPICPTYPPTYSAHCLL